MSLVYESWWYDINTNKLCAYVAVRALLCQFIYVLTTEFVVQVTGQPTFGLHGTLIAYGKGEFSKDSVGNYQIF